MAGYPAPSKAFSFDPMSRAIYLAFAGLCAGTVLQADAWAFVVRFRRPGGDHRRAKRNPRSGR